MEARVNVHSKADAMLLVQRNTLNIFKLLEDRGGS